MTERDGFRAARFGRSTKRQRNHAGGKEEAADAERNEFRSTRFFVVDGGRDRLESRRGCLMKPDHYRSCRLGPRRCRSTSRRGSVYWRGLLFSLAAVVLVAGIVAVRTATQVSELEPPSVAVEPVVNGMFLKIPVADQTRDQMLINPWLRLAMNTGHRAATSVRRYQIADILVRDGQHPETGEPAVLVMITPKAHEYPDPPFDPVAIRRWKPPADRYYSLDRIAEMQRVHPPNEADLQRLAEVWSGDRVSEAESMVGYFYRLLLFTGLGIGLIVLAGAYRSFQWLATRWDSATDQQKSRGALVKLRKLKVERTRREGVDSN